MGHLLFLCCVYIALRTGELSIEADVHFRFQNSLIKFYNFEAGAPIRLQPDIIFLFNNKRYIKLRLEEKKFYIVFLSLTVADQSSNQWEAVGWLIGILGNIN